MVRYYQNDRRYVAVRYGTLENSDKNGHPTVYLVKYKISDLKINTNRFEIEFCTITFLQILIPTKNEFLI
jgi:hypothetical protein